MKRSKGFTLIEILVALMIFAIMGVLAAASLQTIIRVHRALKKSDRETMQLMMTMTLLRRDISQVIDRPVQDASGGTEPGFTASGSEILFTRAGLLNPFDMSRQSNMQRIGYVLQGSSLVRLTWSALDRAPHSEPERQILLSNVRSLKWQMLTKDQKTSLVWPQPKNKAPLPKAVLMLMQVEGVGVVQGVFPIPARGVNATQTQTAQPAPAS